MANNGLLNFSQCKGKEYRGHKGKVHTVKWSADGRKLASGSTDTLAKIWTVDLSNGALKKIQELKGHAKSIEQLSWNPASVDTLATVSLDKTCKIWDTKAPKCVQNIETVGENINVTFHPLGTHLVIGNKTDNITVLDCKTWNPIFEKKFDVEINEMAWDITGKWLYLTTGAGHVKIYDFPLMETCYDLNTHTANCYCISFDSSNRYFAVGAADALVSLWDTQDLICQRTFGNLDWPVRTLGFSHDGTFIAMGSEDLCIDIANVETGISVYQLKCVAATNFLSWNPKRYALAYAGDEVDRTGRDEGNLRIFGFS